MSKKTLVIILLFTIFTLNPISSYFSAQILNTRSFTNVTLVGLPIFITDNSQLAAKASSGNGNSENPYIIQNYVINGCTSNTTGISIQNTNKYFILRNITVSFCYNGFSFSNVTFGSIINSFANNNSVDGFVISSSSNNNLIHDMATGNNVSFALASSSNNVLTNNIAMYSEDAFGLVSSYNNTLKNNTATYNNYNGLYLAESPNNVLVSNIANNNMNGLYLAFSSNNNILTNNTAIKNSETALI